MEDHCWFGLGGNCGDVYASLARARTFLTGIGTSSILASNVYASAPWGLETQANFINQVVGIRPTLSVEETLKAILRFEEQEGRERTVKWGPRTIDVDILYYPQAIREDVDLIVPHPRIHERRFVLVPWAELAPNLLIPKYEATVKELLDTCPDDGWVELMG